MLINAMDYASLNAAIAAAEPGDRIYVPGVRPWPSGNVLTKSVEIFGDGPGTPGALDGTTFIADNADVFTISSHLGAIGSIHLRDFKIKQSGTLSGGTGIKCVTPGHSVDSLRLERISALGVKSDAFVIDAAGQFVRNLEMTSCLAVSNERLGLLLRNVRLARLVNSFFNSNGHGGVYAENSGVAIYVGGMEQNSKGALASQGQIEVRNCPLARLDACHFELFAQAVNTNRDIACDIADGGGAIVLGGCYFALDNSTHGTAIRIQAGTKGPVTVLCNRHTRVTTLVEVAANTAVGALLPQFDDGADGTSAGVKGDYLLPSPPGGMVGCTSVRRVGVPGPDQLVLRGLLVPSGTTPPTTNVQDGMLFFETDQSPPALLVRVAGAWRRVLTA